MMILTATKTFQLLVEICAHLSSQGFSPSEGEDYDAKVGFLAASWVKSNACEHHDVFMLSNALCIYCGYDALRRFCDDVEEAGFEVPYDFHNLGPDEFIVRGHPGLDILPMMDIYNLALRGQQLGWKRDWCPFRNNAEILWYGAWEGADRERPDLVAATQRLAQVYIYLSKS